jgi:hypothetical protein
MKKFSTDVSYCNECPVIGYIHYNGEGDCAPYQYGFAKCYHPKIGSKCLPTELAKYADIPYNKKRPGEIPVRTIPDWCPLEENN